MHDQREKNITTKLFLKMKKNKDCFGNLHRKTCGLATLQRKEDDYEIIFEDEKHVD